MKFAAQSERFSAEQRSLLEDEIEADLAAVDEIEQLAPACSGRPRGQTTTQTPAAASQPAAPRDPPRTRVHHLRLRLPDETHRRGRGREAGLRARRVQRGAPHPRQVGLRQVRNLTQAPVEAHVIDKGIPTAGLLAQVLVAKYADHLPLYRQEAIFGRAGLAIPRSTLAQWVGTCGVQLQPLVDALKAEILSTSVLHADETPVQMLKPGNGKTHRAYLWAYAPGAFEDMKAVVYDFCESAPANTPGASWVTGGQPGLR
jgi:transposase